MTKTFNDLLGGIIYSAGKKGTVTKEQIEEFEQWIEKHTQEAKSQIVEQILEIIGEDFSPSTAVIEYKGITIGGFHDEILACNRLKQILRLQIKEELNKL